MKHSRAQQTLLLFTLGASALLSACGEDSKTLGDGYLAVGPAGVELCDHLITSEEECEMVTVRVQEYLVIDLNEVSVVTDGDTSYSTERVILSYEDPGLLEAVPVDE